MAVREEVGNTGMKPRVGQTVMSLPITFNYNGGRSGKNKTAKVWAVVLFIFSIICFFGMLFRKDSNILVNILLAVGSVYAIFLIIRFPLMGEQNYRKDKIKLIDEDYQISLTDVWGIYDFGDMYPYIARFRNGKSGIFVLLHKDVILGKYAQQEYDNYEAIGDAYNICGSSDIQICHIDYMDLIGSDERLDESFASLDRVKNIDARDLLTDIYTYQQITTSKQVTTFDSYLFLWSGNDDSAWATIQRILSCFLDGNYRGYKILNKADCRELTKVILNLEDFSVEKGMLSAFAVSEESKCVIPIKVIHSDGTEEVLNKTSAERREEMLEKQREIELRKEEIKARKEERKKKSKEKKQPDKKSDKEVLDEDEEIELF